MATFMRCMVFGLSDGGDRRTSRDFRGISSRQSAPAVTHCSMIGDPTLR
jgi:hypothetical protein